ncbi:MAG: hypothetical protein IJ038_02060 [Clostridia bacterium]|nr:hypothetical protein [Clostridia bacterium]
MKNENNKSKINGKIILLILGAAVGVLLLVYGSYAELAGDSGENEAEGTSAELSMDPDEYARETEERIAQICSGVRGVKNVKVVVTLSGGYNAVYAQNSQSGSSGYKNEFVLTGNGSSEKPLLIGYSAPQISGVGIVCVGGGDSSIRQEIISLVGAAFGVSTNKIYVAEAQN